MSDDRYYNLPALKLFQDLGWKVSHASAADDALFQMAPLGHNSKGRSYFLCSESEVLLCSGVAPPEWRGYSTPRFQSRSDTYWERLHDTILRIDSPGIIAFILEVEWRVESGKYIAFNCNLHRTEPAGASSALISWFYRRLASTFGKLREYHSTNVKIQNDRRLPERGAQLPPPHSSLQSPSMTHIAEIRAILHFHGVSLRPDELMRVASLKLTSGEPPAGARRFDCHGCEIAMGVKTFVCHWLAREKEGDKILPHAWVLGVPA